ncbi:TetR/AcrR family transcriptional regulator [Parvularcula marina]|uniref:TetR/AcrR family transcriptional regulator n=2 Tax=Parvularcula marina TaxID=2292771 RepID=A0A371RFN6_9PROT|nr:TetR/AcrR family transcriptional regulator [Parvularcula marina]
MEAIEERMSESYADYLDRHRSERREKFIRNAADVLAERGIRNTTMDHVAEKAGVSKIVLYRYFGAKDKMVHAVLEDISQALLDADEEPAEWWTERVRRSLPVAREHASAMKLLVRHSAHDPEYGTHLDRLTDELIRRTQERDREILGDGTEGPTDARLLAETITAVLLNAYVRWVDMGSPENDDQFLEWINKSVRAMSYYWRGLEPD